MAKYTRKVSRKSSRKVKKGRKGSRKQRGGQTTTGAPKVVKVYFKRPTTGNIDLTTVKSSDPMVTGMAVDPSKVSLTLGLDQSLGNLTNVVIKGYSTSNVWVVTKVGAILGEGLGASIGSTQIKVQPSDLTSYVLKSNSKTAAGPIPGSTGKFHKLPVSVATLGSSITFTNVNLSNMGSLSATGDAANGGANALIELTFQ